MLALVSTSGKSILERYGTLQEHISEQQHRLIIRVLYMVTILQQMMDIFWDSKEALTSVDIVKMQVKATWTNGLVHNIIRSLVQNGYLKECGMEQFGRQYARKLMPALTREEYIAKLMIQKSEGKSSVKQMVVALAKESEDMEQVIEELEEIIRKLKEEQ